MRKPFIVLAVLVVAWMAGYAYLSRGLDATAYRELCVKSAQSALDGLDLARRATAADLPGPYTTAVLGDAQTMIQASRSTIAGQPPPDEVSKSRQAALLPLLDQAERAFEETDRQSAPDTEDLEEQLRAYIADNS